MTDRAKAFAERHHPGSFHGVRVADLARLLDAYEVAAWVPVTDDLSTRPPNLLAVLVAREHGVAQARYSVVDRVWILNGRDLHEANGERPTHWRLMPPGPRT